MMDDNLVTQRPRIFGRLRLLAKCSQCSRKLLSSLMSASYVYSTPGHIVEVSECDTCMHIYPLYMLLKYIACMCILVDILISSTYMATRYEVDVADDCVGAHMHLCCIYVPIEDEGNVSYIYNVCNDIDICNMCTL